jgi:hypothetical protein
MLMHSIDMAGNSTKKPTPQMLIKAHIRFGKWLNYTQWNRCLQIILLHVKSLISNENFSNGRCWFYWITFN